MNEISRHRDVCIVKIEMEGGDLYVATLYASPSEELLDSLAILQERLDSCSTDSRWLILGDFNAKSEVWGGSINDIRGEQVIVFCLENNLEILNDPASDPTFSCSRGESWIDLAMGRSTEVMSCKVSDYVMLSDHNLIVVTLGEREKLKSLRKVDVKRIDWLIG